MSHACVGLPIGLPVGLPAYGTSRRARRTWLKGEALKGRLWVGCGWRERGGRGRFGTPEAAGRGGEGGGAPLAPSSSPPEGLSWRKEICKGPVQKSSTSEYRLVSGLGCYVACTVYSDEVLENKVHVLASQSLCSAEQN